MGSVGAPQPPWPLSSTKPPSTTTTSSPAPASSSTNNYNYNFRDCSLGICTLYCPQWCIPPPYDPSSIGNINNDDDGSGARLSPLMVALISVLASAFLLLSYYTIVSKYCKRRRHNRHNHQDSDEELRLDQLISDSAASETTTAVGGLDESHIRSITVFKYKKDDGLIDGTDCAVCLNEFNEEERLRLMPNCQHAYHIPCIDTWLKTHSSCPICRAGMIVGSSNTSAAAPTNTPTTNNNNNSAAVSAAAGNGNRGQNSGGSSGGPVRSNNNRSVSALQLQSRVREVTVVLVGDDENRGREVTVQLELPVFHGDNNQDRGEGNEESGVLQQQQQRRVMNEVKKEEIQR